MYNFNRMKIVINIESRYLQPSNILLKTSHKYIFTIFEKLKNLWGHTSPQKRWCQIRAEIWNDQWGDGTPARSMIGRGHIQQWTPLIGRLSGQALCWFSMSLSIRLVHFYNLCLFWMPFLVEKNKKRFSSNHYFVSVYLDTHTRIQTKRQKEEETLLGEYALYSLYFNHTILTALKMYTSDTFYYPDGVKRVYKTKTVKPSHRGDFLEHISSQFLEQVRK